MMILWLNGPYGVGKSTVADVLHSLLPESFIFDAEQVGNAIRDNLPPELFRETFEEYPLWLEMCAHLLLESNENSNSHVIVPMTLKRSSSIAIFQQLRDAGAEARHIILEADESLVHHRIVERGEEPDCWCAVQTESCLESQQRMVCDLRLNAAASPQVLAKNIIHAFFK